MATSFDYTPRASITAKGAAGYQRTAALCYLWRLPLDKRDTRILRIYNKELNETSFVVSGLPVGSRPQSLWKNNSEVFGVKLRVEQDGAILFICLKTNVPYNKNWEVAIISPAT